MTQEERKKRRKLITARVKACRALRLAQEAKKALQLAQKTKGKEVFAREQLDEFREILLKQRELSC